MTSDLSSDDRSHLERAVALGRRGWGRVHPNPMVGCVLVKDGVVVAEGYHEEFGGPHAEVAALERAGLRAEGCTAYVSLEPCRHQGKTPACTDALRRAGVARVVFGAADPGQRSGGGGAELEDAGIRVVGPVFSKQRAFRENPAFHHGAVTETPFVALKLALSLDGGVAARPGERTRITGPEATREVHRLRAGFDAVLVGSVTARVDDPQLTVREDVAMRQPPARVVLDSDASLRPDAALFRDVDRVPVVVFTRSDAHEGDLERLEEAGARVHPVGASASGDGLELQEVFDVCWETGIRSILCEGGGRLAAALLRADRVQRTIFFVAPRLLGDAAVPGFPGGPPFGPDRWTLAGEPRAFGNDVRLVYDRRDASTA